MKPVAFGIWRRPSAVFITVVAVVLLRTEAAAADPRPPSGVVTQLPWDAAPPAAPAHARAAAIAELGRALFNDAALSASGRMACSSCHDPAHGFSAPNGGPVQEGGPDLNRSGIRAVPGLTYTQFTPGFTAHTFESDASGDDSTDQGPTGGLDWDGRVDRARNQARLPLLDPAEMANSDAARVTAAVGGSAYAGTFRSIYGQAVFADSGRAFGAITEALEFYLQTPSVFSPFSSKYDAFLRGRAVLTEPEEHGLALFNDPTKGNCAQCHPSSITIDDQPPMFTDFGYVALGVPRNREIPANADPGYFDLGLCGPTRHDLSAHRDYCGLFKTPSLRNVGLKASFFHNGIVRSLRDAVRFYAERDTHPDKWYPMMKDGQISKFDDLPTEFAGNVSVEAPFGGHPGDPLVLSPAEVDDLVAFLRTLSDGYTSATANRVAR